MSKRHKSRPPSGGVRETPTARATLLPIAPRWLALNLALVFVLGAVLGWRQIISPDLGFHLSSGRWIVEHGAVPRSDPFSFTFGDHPYYDLQWLFQLTFYGAHQLGGTSLMLVFKLGLTFAFWALLLVRSWRREGRIPRSAPWLLLLVALADFSEERPHLFSWVYGSLVLWILEEQWRGNRRWLATLPVILLLWANTHSLFVLGLVMLGVGALWELRKGRAGDRRLLVCAGVAGLVCLLNPYFVRGLILPLIQFRDIQPGQIFTSAGSGIFELQSPFSFSFYFQDGHFVLFQPALYWHCYLALAMLAVAADWRRARVPELVLFVLFFYLFWRTNKSFGYFVMATFPLVAGGLDAVATRLRFRLAGAAEGWRTFAESRWPVAWTAGTALLSLVLILLVVSGRWYKLGWTPYRPGPGFNAACLPVEACRFLQRHQVQGRVLTTFGTGGYVNWATRLPVSIHGIGEVVGPKFFSEYVESKTPDAFPRYLMEWKPTIAVVPFTEVPFWLYYLNTRPDWRLVQHDDTFAVFLHESVIGPPAMPGPKADVDYPGRSREEIVQVLRKAADRPRMTVLEWLRGSDVFPQSRLRLSGFYLQTGKPRASIGEGVQGLSESEILVPEFFLILGHAFDGMKEYALSDFCFETFLRAVPNAPEKAEIEAVKQSRRWN